MNNLLTKENGMSHIKILDSVGAIFNTDKGFVMPMMADGSFDVDNPMNIMECDTEWFDKHLKLPRVKIWLDDFLNSTLLSEVMLKYKVWEKGDPEIIL